MLFFFFIPVAFLQLGLFCCCFFFKLSQANPSQVLDGEAWPTVVTWTEATGGHKTVLLPPMRGETQLLHTPWNSPGDRRTCTDIKYFNKNPNQNQQWVLYEREYCVFSPVSRNICCH